MIKVVDVVYHCHNEYDRPQQVLDKHRPSLGFVDFITNNIDIQFVKHLNYEGIEKINNVQYAFFKSKNRFWYIPFKTHRYIKSQRPDIVIVEGMIFPLQLMMLKFMLGKRTIIVTQHHGEKPFKGIKGFFQAVAGRYISACTFTSLGNTKPWLDAGIISDQEKCYELLEASTDLKRKDKQESRSRCGITKNYNFLWVGRLDSNKDPLTVLKGFLKFAGTNPEARLYMIYQEDYLLNEIHELLKEYAALTDKVILKGKIAHEELAYWYSATEFYVSGSHKEGSGYALLEAMACGCIPVATDIPSFKKITADGKYALLYPAGDEDALTEKLFNTRSIDIDTTSPEVERYFNEKLGFKKIADDLSGICEKLVSIKR